jgi:acetoin utilization deacetylase AcuC-like enzyme
MLSFVSHYDCGRHDTGWGHPDHQGRLPAVMRAVYADMLTLFEHLMEVEGRHASGEELGLVHTPAYLERLRQWSKDAEELGTPSEVEPGIVVSGASWDAARAAVGCVLTAVDIVLEGGPPRAFCASRPPGAGARADGPGGFALLNSVAVGARYILEKHGAGRVIVVEWRGTGGSAIPRLLSDVPGATVLSLGPGDGGSGAPELIAELRTLLHTTSGGETPALVLLANGLDILAADPIGGLGLTPDDVYEITTVLREWAMDVCGGRIVSVLEGGYAAPELGVAVVQHIRGLAALPRAA